jgi:type I restriction enzyme S subunit
MSASAVSLGEIIELSGREKVGARDIPIMSITMRDGLIDQAERFKKRIASSEISGYKYDFRLMKASSGFKGNIRVPQ